MPGLKSPIAYDFAFPSSSRSSARSMDSASSNGNGKDLVASSWSLTETSSTTQSLTPANFVGGIAAPSFEIKTRETGGFMNRKPHMSVSRQCAKGSSGAAVSTPEEFAEVRFEPYGTATAVSYKMAPGKSTRSTGTMQNINLEGPSMGQRQICTIDSVRHVWAPLGPSRKVLELVSEESKQRIAMFVYGGENPAVSDPASNSFSDDPPRASVTRTSHVEATTSSKSKGKMVGDLYILEPVKVNSSAANEVIGSALAIVERAKRRAGNARSFERIHIGAGSGLAGATTGGRS